jgi:hypothetical protein
VEAWFFRGVLGEAGDGTVVVVLELDGRVVAAGPWRRRWLKQSTYSRVAPPPDKGDFEAALVPGATC